MAHESDRGAFGNGSIEIAERGAAETRRRGEPFSKRRSQRHDRARDSLERVPRDEVDLKRRSYKTLGLLRSGIICLSLQLELLCTPAPTPARGGGTMNDRTRDDRPDGSRRRLLQAGAGALALNALPGAGLLPVHAQGAFDWKRFKGEKIEVFLVKSPRGDLLTKYHKEFEDLTGIEVGSETIPEQQQRQKAVIEFNSGNTSFDVVAISYHVQKRLFGKNKWMEDVRPLVADKSVTDPQLDFADFSKGGMAWATQPDGRIDSLPFNIDP